MTRSHASGHAAVVTAPFVGRRDEDLEIAVIVPMYNTAPTVASVIKDLVDAGAAEVLAIDNASADGTVSEVAALAATDAGVRPVVTILQNDRNLGYGGSIQRGFAQLSGGTRYIAVMHSDDQCDVDSTLGSMLAAARSGVAPDVVLASRFLAAADTRQYSRVRRLGNTFFNWLTRAVSGLPMSDAGTAIMVARPEVIASIPFDRLTTGYRFHCQLNLLLYGNPDMVIAEVPLAWRDASVGVRFSLVGYGIGLLRLLAFFAWRRRVLHRPLEESVIYAEPGKA